MNKPAQPNNNKQENPLVSALINIILPAMILMKLSEPERLGQLHAFLLAVALPLAYGVWDFIRAKKANFFSILGFISVLLTGGLGLLEVSGFWFAVKEAAIPALIGFAVIFSLKTKTPLVKTFLYNDKVLDVEKVDAKLLEHQATSQFDHLLKNTTYLLAASFFLSAALNFGLAYVILQSPAGTTAFNEELGKMTLLSYPVIVVPCLIVTMFALWRLFSGIKSLTGLDMNAIFKGNPPKS